MPSLAFFESFLESFQIIQACPSPEPVLRVQLFADVCWHKLPFILGTEAKPTSHPSFRDLLSGVVWTIKLLNHNIQKEPEKEIRETKFNTSYELFSPSTLVSCGEIMVKQKSKVEFENQELSLLIFYYM